MALVHEILHSDEPAKDGSGVGTGDHLKVGTGGRGAGPLGIYHRLVVVPIGTGIRATPGVHRRERSSRVGIEPTRLPKRLPVVGVVDVGVLDQSNGLPWPAIPTEKSGLNW